MGNRRAFLQKVGAATVLPALVGKRIDHIAFANAAGADAMPEPSPHELGFKPHWIRQGNGLGGWGFWTTPDRYGGIGEGAPSLFKF